MTPQFPGQGLRPLLLGTANFRMPPSASPGRQPGLLAMAVLMIIVVAARTQSHGAMRIHRAGSSALTATALSLPQFTAAERNDAKARLCVTPARVGCESTGEQSVPGMLFCRAVGNGNALRHLASQITRRNWESL